MSVAGVPPIPTTAPSDAMSMGGQRPPPYGGRYHHQPQPQSSASVSSASFTPLVTVDTASGGGVGGAGAVGSMSTEYNDYFGASSSSYSHGGFNLHQQQLQQPTYASLIAEAENHHHHHHNQQYGGSPSLRQQPMVYGTNSGGGAGRVTPSLQRFIGSLTSKLPDLQVPGGVGVGGGGGMEAAAAAAAAAAVAYSVPHVMGLAASAPSAPSPHPSNLISPAYSPRSVTNAGGGGGGKRSGGGANSMDQDGKPGSFKSRSKKESHNRSAFPCFILFFVSPIFAFPFHYLSFHVSLRPPFPFCLVRNIFIFGLNGDHMSPATCVHALF